MKEWRDRHINTQFKCIGTSVQKEVYPRDFLREVTFEVTFGGGVKFCHVDKAEKVFLMPGEHGRTQQCESEI